jgi:hypothetical protein
LSGMSPGDKVPFDLADTLARGLVYDKSQKVTSFDFAIVEDSLAADCAFAASVSEAGNKEDFYAQSNEYGELVPRSNPLGLAFECRGDQPRSIYTERGWETTGMDIDDALGAEFMLDEGLRSDFRAPLTGPSLIYDGFGTLGDVVYVTPDRTLVHARLLLRGPSLAGGPCTAAGIHRLSDPEKGEPKDERQAVFFDSGSGQRLVFHRRNGLTLSATCSSNVLTIFASTTKPGSLLQVSAVGDSGPIQYGVPNFTATEENPEDLLILGNIQRTGQIFYATPKGRVVALSYEALVPNGPAPCTFAAMDSAVPPISGP